VQAVRLARDERRIDRLQHRQPLVHVADKRDAGALGAAIAVVLGDGVVVRIAGQPRGQVLDLSPHAFRGRVACMRSKTSVSKHTRRPEPL
jgi:hypothetical protein